MNHVFNIKVAGMIFNISVIHPYVLKSCSQFWTKEIGDHKIVMTQEDIDNERLIAKETIDDHNFNADDATDYYLEFIALLRKLANYICDFDRLLMHGSAIAINGKGYIFTALSGTGKSTHTGLLRQLHGENAVMINDDKPFLHYEDGKVFISGTPWMGKHNLGNNITVPLAGVFFLRRSENNVLESITPTDALMKMISQCHRPSDPLKLINTLDLVDKILAAVSLYDLGCNMDISAAELTSSVMN